MSDKNGTLCCYKCTIFRPRFRRSLDICVRVQRRWFVKNRRMHEGEVIRDGVGMCRRGLRLVVLTDWRFLIVSHQQPHRGKEDSIVRLQVKVGGIPQKNSENLLV